jgi:hypothetical protein
MIRSSSSSFLPAKRHTTTQKLKHIWLSLFTKGIKHSTSFRIYVSPHTIDEWFPLVSLFRTYVASMLGSIDVAQTRREKGKFKKGGQKSWVCIDSLRYNLTIIVSYILLRISSTMKPLNFEGLTKIPHPSLFFFCWKRIIYFVLNVNARWHFILFCHLHPNWSGEWREREQHSFLLLNFNPASGKGDCLFLW